MILKIDLKKTFLVILSTLLMSNFVVLYDIPLLKQIFGIIFLILLPGSMFLILLKLDEVEFVEKIVLLVGLSISFLMIFGLFLNNILIYFGYLYPLSTSSLLVSFDLAFLFLMVIIYKRSQDITFNIPFLKLTTYDKIFLIMVILFPALTVFGTFLMNSKDNNSILLFTLVLIPIYVAGLCFAKSNISKNIYPVSVYSISISLLLIFMLRFSHISGHDVHFEYYIFQTTIGNLYWGTFLRSTLDSSLSISLLPTIFQSVLGLNSQEFLFKGVYVFVCSFCPLAIYTIANKYVDELYAFLASFFFMSQPNFLVTAGNARTSLAVFFVALAVMVLFDDKIRLVKKRFLFLIFMICIILSHYSTTYIFFIVFASSYVLLELLSISKKFTFTKTVKSTTVFLFFTLIFLWYSQITKFAFKSGVRFFGNTIAQFNNFFLDESRSSEYVKLAGTGLAHPISSQINLAITLGSFIFIAVGVLTICYRYKYMIAFSNVQSVTPPFLKNKFDIQYVAMAIICSGLLVVMIVFPYVSLAYEGQRLFILMMVVLSICFVIGGIELSKYLHIKPHLLILIILLPYFLFYSGAANEIFHNDGPISLNSKSSAYDLENIYESESVSAKWLKSNIQIQSQVHTSDSYTILRLVSQGPFLQTSINKDCFYFHEKPHEGYIYLGYNNIVNKELAIDKVIYDIKDYSDVYSDMSKIYNNKESEIYHV